MPILGHADVGPVAIRCSLEPIFSRGRCSTCDNEIMDYCASIGVEAVMTSSRHERASDRIQERSYYLERLQTKEI